jgi:hypothetical protein
VLGGAQADLRESEIQGSSAVWKGVRDHETNEGIEKMKFLFAIWGGCGFLASLVTLLSLLGNTTGVGVGTPAFVSAVQPDLDRRHAFLRSRIASIPAAGCNGSNRRNEYHAGVVLI